MRATRTRQRSEADPLTPLPVSLPRLDIWRDMDRQAAKFHAWLLTEDWEWLARALGLVVELGNLPKTISANTKQPGRANIEVHAVRTAMKRGSLGFREPHMVVVVTQWRAGFLDRTLQQAKDQEDGAFADAGRDFKYRAGCTLLIDPEGMKIRRVIRTPGNIADDGELERMRRYLIEGLPAPDAFRGIARQLGVAAEPFAFLHAHAED